MQTEVVSIADLVAPPRNVRAHPEKQIAEFARAIEKFGQIRPVVIDEDNIIRAGNGLVEACRRLGRSEVTVYRLVGLSAADKTKLMLSDNRIYSLGLDDHGAILDLIRGLDISLDSPFDIPGFDEDILKNLTLDTSAVTGAALDDYGVLSDDARTAAAGRTIERGSTAADADRDEDDADADSHPFGLERDEAEDPARVTCPNCGHVIVP